MVLFGTFSLLKVVGYMVIDCRYNKKQPTFPYGYGKNGVLQECEKGRTFFVRQCLREGKKCTFAVQKTLS